MKKSWEPQVMRRLVAGGGIFVMAATVVAAENSCDDVQRKGGTQAEMNRCAQQDYERQDKALNEVYRNWRARLAPDQQALLKKAQQAWLQYRDASCDLERSAVKGGSAESMVAAQCLARKTAERMQELRHLSECEEGGVSCVR